MAWLWLIRLAMFERTTKNVKRMCASFLRLRIAVESGWAMGRGQSRIRNSVVDRAGGVQVGWHTIFSWEILIVLSEC